MIPWTLLCTSTKRGEATFCFYSSIAPGLPGLHEDGIALKHGKEVDFGDLNGVIPRLNGFVEPTMFDVKINQFLVVAPDGVNEFVGIRNTGNEVVDVDGWEIIVDEEFVIELEDSLPPGGTQSDTTFVPDNRVIIDFDFDPTDQPIPAGSSLDTTYESQGVVFSAVAFNQVCNGVFANSNWFDFNGFGSSPNVVSMCPNSIAADISDDSSAG